MKSIYLILLALSSLGFPRTAATPQPGQSTVEDRHSNVHVSFPGGTVIGRSVSGNEAFTAIPFAKPPIGELRLRPPERFTAKLIDHDGTGLSPACPQEYVDIDSKDILNKVVSDILKLPLFDQLTGKEDCLTITVQRPAGTKADAKLPVLFWMYGGAFVVGATNTYDATGFIEAATHQGQPFIFVAVNYRLGAFGFMGGSEVLDAGVANLGLLDQRMGLEWVADNIAAFGGDPDKVTIWGESAGAISVIHQMLLFGGNATYKGKPLFRAGIMNSGSVWSTEPVDCPSAQKLYDEIVSMAGCSGAADTLQCLRQVPYEKFYEATTTVPGALALNMVRFSFIPRPDGNVLLESPDVMVKKGQFHEVPIIIGNQEDEGTLFTILSPNVTNANAIVDFLSRNTLPNASRELIAAFVDLYPEDLSAGSPFRTGLSNELYPGFKRFAAVWGDYMLILPRRYLLETIKQVKPSMPTWSYLASYDHATPVLGTFHASDILQIFYPLLPNYGTTSIRTYYLNFVHNMNPNIGKGDFSKWPQWSEDRQLMWFESQKHNSFIQDSFRQDRSDFLSSNYEKLRM